MVGFDTTILPGREGSVTEEVSVAKVHAGSITKCITVNSNAKNKPELRLCIKANVLVPLGISPNYITVKKDSTKKYQVTVTVTTDKKDLTIKDVSFVATPNASPGQPTWKADLPIQFTPVLKPGVKHKDDAYFDYELILTPAGKLTVSQPGEFVVKTNHSQVPEVKISGAIEADDTNKK